MENQERKIQICSFLVLPIERSVDTTRRTGRWARDCNVCLKGQVTKLI